MANKYGGVRELGDTIENKVMDSLIKSEEFSLTDQPRFNLDEGLKSSGNIPVTRDAYNVINQLMQSDIQEGVYDAKAFQKLGKDPMAEYLMLMIGRGNRVAGMTQEALRRDVKEEGTGGPLVGLGDMLQETFGGDWDLMVKAAQLYGNTMTQGVGSEEGRFDRESMGEGMGDMGY